MTCRPMARICFKLKWNFFQSRFRSKIAATIANLICGALKDRRDRTDESISERNREKKREEKQKVRTKMTVKEECRNKGERMKKENLVQAESSTIHLTWNSEFLILAGCHDYNTTCWILSTLIKRLLQAECYWLVLLFYLKQNKTKITITKIK